MSGNNLGLVRQVESVHLLFREPVSDTRQLSAKLMETFDVGRLVFMKKSPKEKTLFRSVILILASQKNASLLMKDELAFDDQTLSIVPLNFQEAEDLIEQKRTKLYVGNIPYPVDNQMLWNYFAQFGKIDYTYILKRPVQRGPKGFGFVIFQGRDSVDRALATRNTLFGVKLNCKLFNNKGSKTKSTNSGDTADKVTDVEVRHDTEDHCRNCCEECSDTEEAQDQEHTEKCLVTEQAETPRQQPSSKRDQWWDSPYHGHSNYNPHPAPQQYGIKYSKSYQYDEESPQVFQSTSYASRQSKNSRAEPEHHPCGCNTQSCNDCWCDMIDSSYFSPPCCLCDHRDGPINCHALLDYAKQHMDHLHLHCAVHKELEEKCTKDTKEECLEGCDKPCSQESHYVVQKKKFMSSGRGNKFNLFGR